jgi:asparagine synthetase B (glutamine-hydrolysing)
MFAFAIWDAVEETLFARSDGKKPLYYWCGLARFCSRRSQGDPLRS